MIKFGWCLDGHHDGCRVHYRNWDDNIIECECECHVGKPKPDLGNSKAISPPDAQGSKVKQRKKKN